MKSKHPGRVILLAAAFVLVLFGGIYAVVVAVINLHALPALSAAAISRIEARTGFNTSIADSGYRFPATVRLRNLRMEASDPSMSVDVDRIDLAVDLPRFLFRRESGGWFRSAVVRGLVVGVRMNGQVSSMSVSEGAAVQAETSSDGTLATAPAVSSGTPADTGVPSHPFWTVVRTLADVKLFPELLTLESGLFRNSPSDTDGAEGFEFSLSGRLRHSPEESRFSFDFSGIAAGEGEVDYSKRSATVHLAVDDVPLTDWSGLLPAQYRYVSSGAISASIDLITPLPGVAEISGSISGVDCTVGHPSMAAEPFTGIDGDFEFSATWDAEAPLPPPRILGRVTGSNPSVIARTQTELRETAPPRKGELLVRKGTVCMNGIEFEFRPALRGLFQNGERSPWFWRAGQPARFELQLELPPVDAQSLLDALPTELVGPFEGMKLAGSFGWSLDLEVPLDRIAEMNWRTSTRLDDFRVEAIPAAFNVYRLDDEFAYIFPDESRGYRRMLKVPPVRPVSMRWLLDVSERTPRQLERARIYQSQGRETEPTLLPSNGIPPFGDPDDAVVDPSIRYFRLEEMSDWIPKAILTTEDGDFFFHHGVNWYSFKHAVERNLKVGEIELGASTLTMQLAKNLFLNLDRAFLRKAHEAFLVFLIEHEARISKERILELYLNIAQFGPNIYGVDHACRHYFGKSPADIDAAEAVWLATVLPSPVRYHRYHEAGAISDGWFEHMKDYMRIMVERERMSEEEYARAVERRPVFVREQK